MNTFVINKQLVYSIFIHLCILLIIFEYCNCEVGEEEPHYCTFFNNRAPTEQPNLANCTWYKGKSCCRNQELASIFKKVKPLKGATKDCQEYLNYLMCYICAPNQHRFYNYQRLSVCREFCNVMRNSCKDAILKGSKIGELYPTGEKFCESRRFEVRSASTGNCFTFDKLEDKTKTSGSDKLHRFSFTLVFLFFFVILYQVICIT